MTQEHRFATTIVFCSQCGAKIPTGSTCQELFNQGQLLEINQPAYYFVHNLSVPCFMLQHNAYSRQGWLLAYDLLRRFLHENLTPKAARRQGSKQIDSSRRTFSFTKGEKLAGVEQIRWAFDVSQVRLDSAEHYCTDVRLWGESILKDAATLVQGAGSP